MTTRFCKNGGYCVSGAEWLPREPFDYDWVPMSPIVGCDQLRCTRCNVAVLSALGCDRPDDLKPAELYDLIAAGDTARVSSTMSWLRLYSCRCHFTSLSAFLRTEPLDDMMETVPWTCSGHPPLELPAVLEGMRIDEQTDWHALAHDALGGKLQVTLHPEPDADEGFWLQRLYRLLEGQPFAERISQAAADLVVDPDPRVRLGAIRFFSLGWNAPGAERLAPALRDHPELFVDVVPNQRTITLERNLLHTLSWRIREGSDPVALDLMRAALHRPFQPLDLSEELYLLAKVDQKWLLDHGHNLVAAVPSLREDLLHALKSAGAPQGKRGDLIRRMRSQSH